MTFTDVPFAVLLAITYPLWLLCRRHYRSTLALLLIASLAFYGHDEWRLLILLAAYAGVDWAVARWITVAADARLPLALGIAFNLGGLVFWKYTPLLLDSVAHARQAFGVGGPSLSIGNWVVPFGISFYAFSGIAYLVEVYRRTIPAERHFLRCLLHLAFFPHLMAGPILRPQEFLAHLQPDTLPRRAEAPHEAWMLLARGYFKKMVLADRIGLAIDPFFAHVGEPATAGVWALPYLYLYAFQIYFDFSGYTDIARGLALLFGFRWPENFNLPYLATSPREFWRRWHMTLSRFLRDYVYIPLGGNRRAGWRTERNVMITMLLGGLWHGGSWSFALWGGLHGMYVVLQHVWEASAWRHRARRLVRPPPAFAKGLAIACTFTLVCLTWSFFRLTAWQQSLACLRSCVVFDPRAALVGGAADPSLWLLLAAYGVAILAARRLQHVARWRDAPTGSLPRSFAHGFTWGVALVGLVLAVLLAPSGDPQPFIYFQF